MKVLTLRGSDKSGKTTTIKLLRDMYLVGCGSENGFYYQGRNDFTAVYEVRIEQNTYKIIVTSYGDKKDVLCKQLLKVYNFYFNTTLNKYDNLIIEELNRQGFRLFVCASRTHGGTCDLLENICNFNEQNLTVIKKEKKYDDEAKAKEIYNEINKILSHKSADS